MSSKQITDDAVQQLVDWGLPTLTAMKMVEAIQKETPAATAEHIVEIAKTAWQNLDKKKTPVVPRGRRGIPGGDTRSEGLQCPHCSRTDFKNAHGLAMHKWRCAKRKEAAPVAKKQRRQRRMSATSSSGRTGSVTLTRDEILGSLAAIVEKLGHPATVHPHLALLIQMADESILQVNEVLEHRVIEAL